MQNQQESCDILHTDWKENKEESGIWNILLKKLRFVAPTGQHLTIPTMKNNYKLHLLFFIGFAVLSDLNQYWLTDWITFIGLQYPQEPGSNKVTLFTPWSINKIVSIKNKGMLIINQKLWFYAVIQERCELEQTTPRSKSTILHPITEFSGKNVALMVNKTNMFVLHFSS